jgi:hypothetical protein
MTITGFFMVLHSTVNIVTITIPIIITIFFFICGGKKEKRGEENTKYIGFRVLGAIFIDIISMIFVIGLFGIAIIFLPGVFSIYLAGLLPPALILGNNLFFTSLGYKLFGIYCCRYKIPVLLYNAYLIFCFFVVLKMNNLLIYIIVGIYSGLDSFFLVTKKTPFVFHVFKINYYLEVPVVKHSAMK